MSLRLFYGDQGTNTRRRSRLTDVLSQGIVDHRAELEERLRTREVPRGAAGLQSVPLLASQPVGAAPESAQSKRSVPRWIAVVVGSILAVGLLVTVLLVSLLPAGGKASATTPVPAPAVTPVLFPPSAPPGLITLFVSTLESAYVAPSTFALDATALASVQAAVTSVAGIGAGQVTVTPVPFQPPTSPPGSPPAPPPGGGGSSPGQRRRLAETATLDTSNCTVGASEALFGVSIEVEFLLESDATTLVPQVLASLETHVSVTDANGNAGTGGCAAPVSTGLTTRLAPAPPSAPPPPSVPMVLAEFVAFNVTTTSSVAMNASLWTSCLVDTIVGLVAADVRVDVDTKVVMAMSSERVAGDDLVDAFDAAGFTEDLQGCTGMAGVTHSTAYYVYNVLIVASPPTPSPPPRSPPPSTPPPHPPPSPPPAPPPPSPPPPSPPPSPPPPSLLAAVVIAAAVAATVAAAVATSVAAATGTSSWMPRRRRL